MTKMTHKSPRLALFAATAAAVTFTGHQALAASAKGCTYRLSNEAATFVKNFSGKNDTFYGACTQAYDQCQTYRRSLSSNDQAVFLCYFSSGSLFPDPDGQVDDGLSGYVCWAHNSNANFYHSQNRILQSDAKKEVLASCSSESGQQCWYAGCEY